MFEVQLSENLLNRIKEAIQNSDEPCVCWADAPPLSVEELQQLRDLPDGREVVEQARAYKYYDLVIETERLHMLNIMEGFRQEIEAEADDHVSEEDLREVIENEDLYSSMPEVNINIDPLITKN